MPQKIPWPKRYSVGFWGRSPEGDILLNYAKYWNQLRLQRPDFHTGQAAAAEWWSKYPDLMNVLITSSARENPFWTKTFAPCEMHFKEGLSLHGAIVVESSSHSLGFAGQGGFLSCVHLCHSEEEIPNLQSALNQENPFLFDEVRKGLGKSMEVFLFGPYLWKVREEELAAEPDYFRLLFLEAVDKDRMQLERLKNKFSGVAGAKLERSREPIPESVRIFVWRRDGGKCVRCGNNERLEFDHIIPLAEGGSNTERNLQLLCEVCNRGKGTKI